MENELLPKQYREVNQVVLLPLADIQRNPSQPRKFFDPESLQELSRSIASNGLLQPIIVRKMESGGYELVAGERRTLAYRSLGREYIPAIVEDYSEWQSAVLALIENIQRRDLNYFEEAAGIEQLMRQFDMTQQQVSVRLGKAQSTIANKLRLLRYPPQLQQVMLQAGLTERHARALLKISDENLLCQSVSYVIEQGYNVAQTEHYLEKLLSGNEANIRTKLFVIKDIRIFQNTLKKAIGMMELAGIPVDSKRTENENFVEYHIRVPKVSVYNSMRDKEKTARKQMGIG